MMTRLRRVVGDHDTSDRGLSLVEVLVAMVLSTLVMTLCVSFFMQTARVTSEANANRTTVGENMTVYNAVTSRVRVAAPAIMSATSTVSIIDARSNLLSFYAWSETTALSPKLSRVTIDVVSNRLRITTCVGQQDAGGFWSFPCGSTQTRTFQPLVVAESGGQLPLFSYQNKCGMAPSFTSGRVSDPSTIQTVTVSVKTKTAGAADARSAYFSAPVFLSNIKPTGTC